MTYYLSVTKNISMENIIIGSLNDDPNQLKRAWVKPDIEMISADDIQGGPLVSYSEAFTTFGFHGAGS